VSDYKATPEQWAQCEDWVRNSAVGASDACILELRARVEALEAAAHKHIVETSANILALASRLEALEVAKRPASRVHEISKPLRLTPDQVQQALDQLRPKSKPSPNSSQIGRLLVERVKAVIELEDEKHYWPSPETSAADPARADMARAAIREVALWLNEPPLDLYPGDCGIVVNALYDQANK
jgi:7-keto-8-aminopelargonate synthetase-like enzyme